MADLSYVKDCLDRALYTLETHQGRIQQRLADAKRDHLDNFPFAGVPGDLQSAFSRVVDAINEDLPDDVAADLARSIIGLRHEVVKTLRGE